MIEPATRSWLTVGAISLVLWALIMLVVLLIFAPRAFADDDCGGVLLPPKEFDHPPTVPVQRIYLPNDGRIYGYCPARVYFAVRVGPVDSSWEPPASVAACSVWAPNTGWREYIATSPRWNERTVPCLVRHEDGHVNMSEAHVRDVGHAGWH